MGILPLIKQSIFPYKFMDGFAPSRRLSFDEARVSLDSKDLHGIEGPYQRLQLEDKYKEDHDMLAEKRKKMLSRIR